MDVQGEKRGRRLGGKYVSHNLEDVAVGVLEEEGQWVSERARVYIYRGEGESQSGTVRTVHRHFLFFPGLQRCRAVRGGRRVVDRGEGRALWWCRGIIGRLQRGIHVVSV